MANVKEKSKALMAELAHSMQVLRALMECSDELRDAAFEMVSIMTDKEADDEEKAAAKSTLAEILFPTYDVDGLGVDLDAYDKAARDQDFNIEVELDAEELSFSDRLTKAMAQRGVSQTELAEKLGVGQSAIAMMLGRKCRPQRRTVLKLAEALGCEPGDLWTGN